jgi:hypothetical protein
MNKKKGIALNQSFGAVLALVLVAVLVIVAIFMFVNLNTTFINIESVTVLNEAGAAINNTGYALTNNTICNFGSVVLTSVVNETSGLAIVLANFSTTAGGVVTNATNISWNAAILNYTYNSGGDACDATNTMIVQFGTYPALVGLVGTIIFLGLVIGVLVASFTFGRREV